MLNEANSSVVPCRTESWLRCSGMLEIIGQYRLGAVRCLTSRPRTASPAAPAAEDRLTTSTTFSRINESEDGLNMPVNCLRLNLRQIRPIVDLLSPAARPWARDHWVASGGISSSVAMITPSTLASRIDGPLGRGSSAGPSSRRADSQIHGRPACLHYA